MKLLKKITPEAILHALSNVSGFSVEELQSTSGGGVSQWKHLGMFVARDRGMTLKQVGDIFGRHFTTVTLAEQKVRKALQDDPEITQAIEAVNNAIDQPNEDGD
tara:strand:+ start:577 stop:888 length:312 start_codon:yes stop_codon:yes gene_type:complete